MPGADANPYLAFAATIAGGLHGIDHKIAVPKMFKGNAYEARRVPRVPISLHEAVAAFQRERRRQGGLSATPSSATWRPWPARSRRSSTTRWSPTGR